MESFLGEDDISRIANFLGLNRVSPRWQWLQSRPIAPSLTSIDLHERSRYAQLSGDFGRFPYFFLRQLTLARRRLVRFSFEGLVRVEGNVSKYGGFSR